MIYYLTYKKHGCTTNKISILEVGLGDLKLYQVSPSGSL